MSLNFLPLQRMFQAIVAPDSMVSETRDMKFAFTNRHNRRVSSPGPRSKNRNLSPIARPAALPILHPTVPNVPSSSRVPISSPSPQAPIAKGKNRGSILYSPLPLDLKPTEDPPPYEMGIPGASGASEPALPMSDIDYAIALQIEEIETMRETFADEEMAGMLDAGIDITPKLPLMRYNLRPRQSGKASTANAGSSNAEQQRHECTSCFDKLNHLVGLRSTCGHFYCLTCVRNMVNISLEGDAASFPPKCCSKPLIGTFADKMDGDAQVRLLGVVLNDPELTELMETKWREISVDPTDRVYCPKPKCSEFLGSAIELANSLTKSEGPSRSTASASPSSPSTAMPSSAPYFLRRFTTPKPPPPPREPVGLKCPKCQSLICILCRQPGHAGESCSERLDVQFWDLVKDKRWKKCPYCRVVVEKNGGCSSVVCRCGRGFSY
ncbi:hypothetical protein JOM56_013240 [Amanita muscaria]